MKQLDMCVDRGRREREREKVGERYEEKVKPIVCEQKSNTVTSEGNCLLEWSPWSVMGSDRVREKINESEYNFSPFASFCSRLRIYFVFELQLKRIKIFRGSCSNFDL